MTESNKKRARTSDGGRELDEVYAIILNECSTEPYDGYSAIISEYRYWYLPVSVISDDERKKLDLYHRCKISSDTININEAKFLSYFDESFVDMFLVTSSKEEKFPEKEKWKCYENEDRGKCTMVDLYVITIETVCGV